MQKTLICVFLSYVFINFIFVFLASGQDYNSGMQKRIHFRTDMEYNICRPVNIIDVSLGYQFGKNITFIGVLDATLSAKVFQWLAADQWFSPVSTNKNDRHDDIAEILLKVRLNTIAHPPILLSGVLHSMSVNLVHRTTLTFDLILMRIFMKKEKRRKKEN